jgi:hypothetical protein
MDARLVGGAFKTKEYRWGSEEIRSRREKPEPRGLDNDQGGLQEAS